MVQCELLNFKANTAFQKHAFSQQLGWTAFQYCPGKHRQAVTKHSRKMVFIFRRHVADPVEEETENLTDSSSQISKTWINAAKDRGRWTLLEENYTLISEVRQENNATTRRRRNNQSRPARYVNGVRLSDEQVAKIT